MKEEIIEVWVSEDWAGTQSGTVWLGSQVIARNPSTVFRKAKLVIEIPDDEEASETD